MQTDSIKDLKSIHKKDYGKFLLELKITSDKMKMFLDLTPHLTPVVFADELIKILTDIYPKVSFDHRVISDIVSLIGQGKPILNRRVAVGSEPLPGTDGKLLLMVKPYSGVAEQEHKEGTKFSFSQLHLFDNVIENTVVARIYPPKTGKDGFDVLGNAINSKAGNPVKITLDKTLVIKDAEQKEEKDISYQNIVAQKSGLLLSDNNQLRICEELTIKDNVDFHTGNIDFIGKVIVGGSILPDFVVKGAKGILVKGDCQKASLSSQLGHIEVNGFCVESRIDACKNVMLNIVHKSKIKAGGKLSIKKECIDSVLRAEKYVSCKQGRIIGGHTFSVYGLEVKQLGCDANSNTDVIFGSVKEIQEDFSLLVDKIKSYAEISNLIHLQLGPYAKNPVRIQLLQPLLRDKIAKLYSKGQEVNKKLETLVAERTRIMETSLLEPDCICNIFGELHGGANFICRGEVMSIKDLIKGKIGVKFDEKEKKFIQGPLVEIKCPIEEDTKS